MTSRRTSAAAASGTKRSHAAISTSFPSLSLSSLAQLSTPPESPSSPAPAAFARSDSAQRLVQSHIPYLYDFFYELSMDWPFYAMAWALPLPASSASFAALSASDRQHYSMQRLYYAQSTDATFDPYSRRFVGNPHLLVQAEMPLPCQACVPDMIAASSQLPSVLEDVFCSYVTDSRKLAHPGEVNRIRVLPARDELVCTHTDSPRVYLWDFAKPRHGMVKLNCRPHAPDLQLVGHEEGGGEEQGGSNPMYFALDTSSLQPLVVSGGPDCKVCLWGVEDYATSLSSLEATASAAAGAAGAAGGVSALLQARSVFRGHTACVEDVCFSPHSSQLFASVGDDRLLCQWDARLPQAASTLHTAHSDDVNAVSWNPLHSHLLLTASDDRLIHLIDIRMAARGGDGAAAGSARKAVLRVYRGHERAVKNVSWAPDGLHFASGGDDAVVNVWSAAAELQPSAASPLPRPLSSLYHEQLAAASSTDAALRFRHACHPTAVQAVQWNPYHAPGLTLSSLHGDSGGQMQIWRMNEALWEGAGGSSGLEEWNTGIRDWRRKRKKEEDEARLPQQQQADRGRSQLKAV